jgi:hypothetical protein
MRALRNSQAANLPNELREDLLRLTSARSAPEKLGCPPEADAEVLQKTAIDRAAMWATQSYGAGPTEVEIAEIARRSYTLLWQQVAPVS